jgi:hypothetical protein
MPGDHAPTAPENRVDARTRAVSSGDTFVREALSRFKAARANGVNEDFVGMRELLDELEHELDARCATHMTKGQLAVLRYYFPAALVTQVRQLHYVPVVIPAS